MTLPIGVATVAPSELRGLVQPRTMILTEVFVAPWQNVTTGAKVEQGSPTGAVRTELAGNTARLRGEIKAKAGEEVKTAETLFTIPAGLRPVSKINLILLRNGLAAMFVGIEPSGVCVITSGSLKATEFVGLDTITWNLT